MHRFDALANVRDTGGTPLRSGGVTRSGVLYRSAALDRLTAADLERLTASPIGVVVDLRTPTERTLGPDLLPTARPVRLIELPVLQGAIAEMAGRALQADPEAIQAALQQLPSLAELYLGMLHGSAPEFAQIARLVAASTDAAPTAVLVHCTAGKDRTGVAIAVLLDAVGADRAAIVADYARSQDHLAGAWADRMRAMVQQMGVPLTPQIDGLLTQTPPAAIEQAFAWIDAQGGSAEYLRSGGLTEGALDALRARLTA